MQPRKDAEAALAVAKEKLEAAKKERAKAEAGRKEAEAARAEAVRQRGTADEAKAEAARQRDEVAKKKQEAERLTESAVQCRKSVEETRKKAESDAAGAFLLLPRVRGTHQAQNTHRRPEGREGRDQAARGRDEGGAEVRGPVPGGPGEAREDPHGVRGAFSRVFGDSFRRLTESLARVNRRRAKERSGGCSAAWRKRGNSCRRRSCKCSRRRRRSWRGAFFPTLVLVRSICRR